MEANNKAMRELAELVAHMNDDGYWDKSASIRALVKKAKDALAAPPKNCEVGTVEEQTKRYEDYCQAHTKLGGCTGCPLIQYRRCQIAWAQMPYEKGVTNA